MDTDRPAYSNWFAPRNIPERTQMALANKSVKPVQPKCEDFEPSDGEPDYSVDEKPEDAS